VSDLPCKHPCLGTTLLTGSMTGTIHIFGQSFFSGSPLIQLQISPTVVGPTPTPSMTQPPRTSTHHDNLNFEIALNFEIVHVVKFG
jgi:hypothetical protein